MTILRAAFHGRSISRFCDISWPQRSPNKPNTLQEIKTNIIEEISLINPAVLESVGENTSKKMRACFNNDGKHFKNIFKK